MSRIAIVSDSAANIPPDLLARHAIHLVSLLIHIDRRTLRDGIDPLPPDSYGPNNSLPSTAAPSASDFLQVYTTLAQSADTIISIHTSSKLSTVCQVARLAADMVEDADIRVIDSGSAAMGQGFIVLEAARLAERGADVPQILQRIAAVSASVEIIATLTDLRYLVHSGRVPAAVGLAGSLLQICPVFSLRDGEAHLLEVRRTRRHAVQRIVDLVAKKAQGHPIHLAVFHGRAPNEAEKLRDEIVKAVNCVEALVTEFTPAMAVHTGPDVLGAAFFVENQQGE